MIVTGLRGVGKTVLLGEFREIALGSDWVVVEMEVSKHDDDRFRDDIAVKLAIALLELSPKARWTQRFRRAAEALKSFSVKVDATGSLSAGLDIGASETLAVHGDLSTDLTDVLVALGEAAGDAKRGVAILVDEVQFLSHSQLEAVIAAVHKTVQRALPVTMVGAGLPQIAELAGDAKSYAERLFQFPTIGHLSDDDARRALAEPAQEEGAAYTEEALNLALRMTGRYPYFLQELGYAVWGVARQSPITSGDIEDASTVYQAKLDSSFFRVRLDRCSELQRAYLRAMAELGPEPQKAADVARLLDRESTQVAPTRSELVSMGLLFTPEHGYAAFTVPHFDQFMKRTIAELEVPPIRRRRPRRRDHGDEAPSRVND